MKRLSLLVCLLVFITLTACQSNHGFINTPSPRNLEGLEGKWTYDVTFRGRFDGWDKYDEVYERRYEEITITSDEIIDEHGYEIDWWYDGERLILNNRYDLYDYNYYCGNVILSIFANIEIWITPGDLLSSIRGDSEGTLSTDYCDWSSGWLTNSGTFRKID